MSGCDESAPDAGRTDAGPLNAALTPSAARAGRVGGARCVCQAQGACIAARLRVHSRYMYMT